MEKGQRILVVGIALAAGMFGRGQWGVQKDMNKLKLDQDKTVTRGN